MKEFYYEVRYELLHYIQSYRSAINHPAHSFKNALITILTLVLLVTELYAVKEIKESKYYNFGVPVAAQTQSISFASLGPQNVESTPLEEGTKFVAPTGSGNLCTEESPCSLTTGISQATAGDVVFLRGGVYDVTSSINFSRTGTAEDNITFESYPGETAIFDGSNLATGTDVYIRVTGSYYNLRKIEIRNMPKAGLWIGGNYNTINGIYSHHNKLSGVQVFSPYENYPYGAYGSHNTIQNVTANDNSDADLGGPGNDYNQGGNADGISISSGEGNVVINSIAERNSDDGVDVWRSTNSVVSYSIAADNGIDDGNGNGFKAGGASPSDGTIVEHSVAYSNRSSGFDANSGLNVRFNYVTSWDNDGYGIYGYASTITRNSISVQNGSNNYDGSGTRTNNSWQRGGTPTFISTDTASADFLKPVVNGGFEDLGALSEAELVEDGVGTGGNYTPSFVSVTGGGNMPSLDDVISAADYGAKGDGVTDDTTALRNAANAAASAGKPLVIPATSSFYKISGPITIKGSVIGRGGMPTIKQTNTSGNTNQAAIFIVSTNTTGWIYNIHFVGTYSGQYFNYRPNPPTYPSAVYPNGEWAHAITLGGVNGLTIKGNIIENMWGDGISDGSGPTTSSPARNVLIDNNTFKNAMRCEISGTTQINGWAIMNNKFIHSSFYVNPIDLEPDQETNPGDHYLTNIEIGHNEYQVTSPYEVNYLAGWFDPTPGGNIWIHDNSGSWVGSFYGINGFHGAPSTWTNVNVSNNNQGGSSPTPTPTSAPTLDTSAPIISSVSATNVTNTTATINWFLDEYATGQVEYGPSVSYGTFSTKENSFTYNYHIQALSGLTPGTTYHFRVISGDQSGNSATSSDFTFTTTAGSSPVPTSTLTPTPTPTNEPTATPTVPIQSISSTPTPIVISSGNLDEKGSSNNACSAQSPGSKPNLYQIDTSLNTASIYFSPANKPYDRYFVQYGYTTEANQFGAEFEISNVGGAIKFIAGNLTPNTTYYFKVKAGNNCASGEWSTVVKATTGKEETVNPSILDKINPVNIINNAFRTTTVSEPARILPVISTISPQPQTPVKNVMVQPTSISAPTKQAISPLPPIRPIAAPVKEGIVSRIINFFSGLFGR